MKHNFPKSLYLHIPFCKRRCFYCDFAITTGGKKLKQQYVDVLCQEIALTVQEIPPSAPLETIFLGGGTPSLLSVSQLAQIFETIAQEFAIASNAEISLEANAGTVSLETLRDYRRLGVNRISLGAQAFQQELLDLCGRGHSVSEIYEAVSAIKQAGFENFNLDLISGLPNQTMADWQTSLKEAIALEPTHLSIYDLTIEEGTAFEKRYQAGAKPLPTDDLTVEMYIFAHEMLTSMGYEHYEISNYAKPSYQIRHNLTYWHNQPFYGMGMGATSYINRQRIDRPRKMREYLEAIALWQTSGIKFTAPILEPVEELIDTLMQGLRLAEGLSLKGLQANYGTELSDCALQILYPYQNQQWVKLVQESDDLRIMLVTPEGWLFSDIIIADLYENL
ncbi:coproporphyrinogen III oxidase [Pseudanabaena sp. FACHB-1998]|uniref:radical SAM family heme chaperone HemW n=1 Tax=Pseudanabaena sp. FACHB-1998 TaxID=2692858 RepID=UPI0016807125|nr:radical SAM family heme chaperone HemW [Pseudanabaena sp. FACHB-1998]MBD2177351.1 coproporphyrinogen III oxidase [Pseudanabaena sp. FACHB-1998]